MFRLVIGLCAASMLSSACTTRNASQQRAEHELTMLVGTYTSGSSKGIYTFRFNEESGVATPLSEIEVSNPSYLTLSPDNRFVYAVSEENDSTAAINAFAFEQTKNKRRRSMLRSYRWEKSAYRQLQRRHNVCFPYPV